MSDQKKIIVINVIDHPEWDVVSHWQDSLKRAGLKSDDFVFVDFYLDPSLLDGVVLSEFEKVIITGSVASPLESKEWIKALKGVVKELLDLKIPTLAVCFGHQFVARVIGGRVEKFEGARRCGNELARLTKSGSQSALFSGLPEEFEVLESFGFEVLDLPDDAEVLAKSEKTGIYAFQYKNLYCTQFHPELRAQIVRDWFANSKLEQFHEDAPLPDLDKSAYENWLKEKVKETPMAQQIINSFVKDV